MIEMNGVTFYREGRPVLDGIDCSIKGTERVAILGNSGAGKTTLLRLILGLERPDSGSIVIDGKDITGMNEKELTAVRTAFTIVFQDGALFDSLNVKENIAFPLREKRRLTSGEIDAAVREIAETVGLQGDLGLMPEELSGGMKRRVAIARALVAQQPSMFLYDEPTSGLDPVNAENICRLMHTLSSTGMGFIMVTHEIIHALSVAERFIFIRNGEVGFDGDRKGLFDPGNAQMREFIGSLNWRAVHGSPESFILD